MLGIRLGGRSRKEAIGFEYGGNDVLNASLEGSVYHKDETKTLKIKKGNSTIFTVPGTGVRIEKVTFNKA
jgi:hypothetical protein